MTGPTHITFAAASTLALVQHLEYAFYWPFSLLVLIGSLAPDLDSRRTALHSPSRLFGRLLPRQLAQLCDTSTKAVAACLRLLVSHRGVLHAPLLGLSLFCLGIVWNSEWLFWFSYAYLGHILMDFCTAGGIPFLFPFSKKTFSAFPIRTGSFFETLLCAGFLWYIAITTWSMLGIPHPNTWTLPSTASFAIHSFLSCSLT